MKCSWLYFTAQIQKKQCGGFYEWQWILEEIIVILFVCVRFGSAEAADQLGTNGKLVERLVEWCEAKDHAGVMGESNRLLSALIRHSKSKVSQTLYVFRTVVD